MTNKLWRFLENIVNKTANNDHNTAFTDYICKEKKIRVARNWEKEDKKVQVQNE